MNTQNYFVSGIIALIVSMVVVVSVAPSAPAPAPDPSTPAAGAITGPDVYSYFNVRGLFQNKGGQTHSYTNSTSSTATTQTLTITDIVVNGAAYSTVVFTPNTNSTTLTFPASSTLSAFLPAAGDWAEQCWVNATGTAAKTITFAAGTGIDLEVGSSSLVINAGNTGCFRFVRKPATASAFDIVAQFTAFVDGD